MGRFLNKAHLLSFLILTFAFTVIILPGCKSIRPVAHVRLSEKPFDELHNQMIKHQPDFTFFNAKIAVGYKSGKKALHFKTRLRIKNDSIIWFSIVPAMGIEIARMEITSDSVKLMNRAKKNYVTGTYHLLDSLLHVSINYQMFQAILLGNDLKGVQTKAVSSSTDKGMYLLKVNRQLNSIGPKSAAVIFTQRIWIDPVTYRIRQIAVNNTNDKKHGIKVLYPEYQNIDSQLFPLRMQILIQSKKKVQIDLLIKKPELDQKVQFPFFIPHNYVKL